MFVAAEATLLAVIVATYFYLRFKNLQWPPRGAPEPKVLVPLLLLALLLSSSVPVFLAARAGRAGRLVRARSLLAAALVLQAAYFGVQVHEYAADLGRFTPHDGAYGSIYFTLLGAHHGHVAVALLLEAWLLIRLASGLTRYRLVGLQAVAFYVHFVNVLAVVVVAVQLSAAA